jgi:putative endonuclease
MKDWYVYILKGSNGVFYKGFTNNLKKRLHQHELGQNETTRIMKGFSLVYVEVCNTRIEARKFEKFLKTGFGREIVRELFST